MANAVEDALKRATTEQREKALQVIKEAQQNIKLVSMRDEITPLEADSISKNIQAIEEAKRTIPFETMQDVNEISLRRFLHRMSMRYTIQRLSSCIPIYNPALNK